MFDANRSKAIILIANGHNVTFMNILTRLGLHIIYCDWIGRI